jgi:hypothetical protein
MPAPVAEGWPIRMCHAGLPDSLLSGHGEYAGHEDAEDQWWESCSLGALHSAAIVTNEDLFQVPFLGGSPSSFVYSRESIDSTTFPFRSRAPPTLII